MTHPDLGTHSLRFQAVAGVFWTALQKWAVRLSTFVGFLILGRLLAPKDFGVVALASAFITIMSILADAGFATYLVQVKELTEDAKHTAFYVAVSFGTALFLLGCAAAYPLSLALDVPELRTILPALSASCLFVGLSSVPAAILTRELKFQVLAMRQVVATVLSVVVAVVLAFAGAGAWALVAQYLVLRVVTTAVLLYATDFRPRREFSRSEARTILSYSSKAMSANLLAQVRDQGEVLLIGAVAGPVALGLWTVATRLVVVIGDLLGSAVGAVAVPLYARVQSDGARLGRTISVTSGLATLVLAPALALLALLSPELVPHLFGHRWQPAAGIASLLAIRGFFFGLSQLDRSVLLNAGRAGGELRLITALTVVHLALVAVVAPHGLHPLAIVLLAEAVLVTPIRPLLIHAWLGVAFRSYVAVASVTAATAVSGGCTLAALHWTHASGIAVYGVVLGCGLLTYPPLLWLLARPVLTEALSAVTLLRRRRGPSEAVLPTLTVPPTTGVSE
jgi:O-antigen/teichoic acid export membrane protein